jgi:DNA polymerase-3 subunit beta
MKIERNALAAAIVAAGKKDVRYYLNGICIEPDFDKAIVIGTDGSMLAAIHSGVLDNDGQTTPALTDTLIVPRETIENALKITPKKVDFIELLATDNDGAYSLAGIPFQSINARYPDWRRIIPNQISGEVGHYAPQLIARAHKALAEYYGVTVAKYCKAVLHQNGTSAALMQGIDNQALVVLMPMRVDDSKPYGFAWASVQPSRG